MLKVSRDDQRQLQKIESEMSKLENDWAEIQSKASEQLVAVQQIESRIDNVGDGSLKQQSNHIDRMKAVSSCVVTNC